MKYKDDGSYFYKNQKYKRLEIEKENCSVMSFFPLCAFSENAQCFVGAFL